MKALVWFRRDLRVADQQALARALREAEQVYCVFVFDRDILDVLSDRADRRVDFIYQSLLALNQQLAAARVGAGLIIRHGQSTATIPELCQELGIDCVYTNRDYEPAAIARDNTVAKYLQKQGRKLITSKDQVIFECAELLTGQGKPYSVFTPYKKSWLARLAQDPQALDSSAMNFAALAAIPPAERWPGLAELGFQATGVEKIVIPGELGAKKLLSDFRPRLERYQQARDFPAVKGVSYLSTALRFGTISVRTLVRLASKANNTGADTWLSELIWREFYQQILFHYPHVVNKCFKPIYDDLVWDERPDWLAAWRVGQTGYPLVDAAMRQLNSSGYMHNRLRMVAASFLIKNLGIDWRLGEAYFAKVLLDFDLASNNGGWQWAASTGCDAQPYFRIFNPITQSERFDGEGKFIRRYVPELANMPNKFIHAPWLASAQLQKESGCIIGQNYPAPLVDHKTSCDKTLLRYGRVR